MATNVRETIGAANERFMEAFGRGDAAGLASTYTRDAKLLPPNSDVVTGNQAIQEFWQGAMNMGIRAATLETVELEDHGDAVIEMGKYTLRGDSAQVLDTGKYVVIWKQDNDQWKLHWDIWNSSMPARA